MMENLLSAMDAILITGPTASGKSALAVELAKRHNGVVVNADSMQVYDTLRVLTARPTDDEMQGVPHYLYGHVPAGSAYSTGAWLRDVEALLPGLRAEGRLPVFVGGTGLYFKALTGGLSEMPDIPDEVRTRLRGRLQEEGAEHLHSRLAEGDPSVAAGLSRRTGSGSSGHWRCWKRRAGRSPTSEAGGPVIVDPKAAQKIVVLPERAILHARINGRFEAMLEQGAEDEVQGASGAFALPRDARHEGYRRFPDRGDARG
jgi:tRNA dimethylallyltransferase